MKNHSITISNYLEWVRDVHNIDGPFDNSSMYQNHVYFRGHASTSWELLPSLFRDVGRIHNEHLMLEMANNMLWNELSDCKTEMEKMIRLQHYGLRTRLIDVTYNPLVALFFACQTPSKPNEEQDGVVYCGYIEEDNNRACQAIAEYVFNNETVNINLSHLEKICKHHDINHYDLETIHFISPPLNNPRISIQNGAFIMSPLLIRNSDEHFNNASYAYIKKELKTAFEKQFTIPENNKSEILKEPDYLGFNKATIYADISDKLQYINEKEDKDEWQIIDLQL